MIDEVSFGIIPVQKKEGAWNVLLVKQHSGDHWGFPKGKPEIEENPRDAAVRELKEETGLEIANYLTPREFIETYQFLRDGENVDKKVTYYLAQVKGEVVLQLEEISGCKWVPLSEASSHITYAESKRVCQQVLKFIDNLM